MTEMFPQRTINTHLPLQCTIVHPNSPRPRPHTRLTRIPALPDRVRTCTCTAAAHHSVHRTGVRTAQPTARPAASKPVPADIALARLGARPALPRSHLEALQRPREAHRFTALELSADDGDACFTRFAGTPHLAALVDTRAGAGAPLDMPAVSAEATGLRHRAPRRGAGHAHAPYAEAGAERLRRRDKVAVQMQTYFQDSWVQFS
ncbi:hypothetical protein BJY52DRAFT_870476 [Lactarius psammicola]|nr:hypothetical protein BJY52DRAFT_870476 [Lactarius psammicola]